LNQVISIFTQPIGEIIYLISMPLLGLVAVWSLAYLRPYWKRVAILKDYALASGTIFILWLVLAVAWGYINNHQPIIEGMVALLTLILIGWVFIDNPTLTTIRNAFVAGVISVIMGVGFYVIFDAGDISRLEIIESYGRLWSGVGTSLSIGFLIGIITGKQDAKGQVIKIAIFAILSGIYAYIFFTDKADFGLSRIGTIAMLLLFNIVVYRAVYPFMKKQEKRSMNPVNNVAQSLDQPTNPALSIERESVQLMRGLGIMLEDSSPETIPHQIIRAVMDVLKVDIAVLLLQKDANYLDVEAGYDRFLEREISGMAINLTQQPSLVETLRSRSQGVLDTTQHENELNDLYTRLDCEQIGMTYFQPMFHDQELIGVIVVGLPYSKYELPRQERELLRGLSVIAGNLLKLSHVALYNQLLAEERAVHAILNRMPLNQVDNNHLRQTRQQLQENLRISREQISDLAGQILDLKNQLETERSRVFQDLDDDLGASQQIVNADNLQRELRAERDELATLLQDAQNALRGAVSKDDLLVYQEMVDAIQRERDDLVNQRETLQAEIDILKNQSGGLLHPDDLELLLKRINTENEHLIQSNQSYRERLMQTYERLRELGIGIDEQDYRLLVGRLSDERDALINENEALQQALQSLEADGTGTAHLLQQINTLQKTLNNVATDRESALKQRDKVMQEQIDLREKLHILRLRWKELEAEAKHSEAKARTAIEEKTILQAELLRLNNERSQQKSRYDALLAEKQSLEMEREQLLARMDGDRQRVEAVGDQGVRSLTNMIAELTAQREQLELDLNQSRSHILALSSENELLHRENQAKREARPSVQEAQLLIRLVQDFRTPMTSIIGYVDLLLGETTGILGEMQRKFLQRVYTNIQRFEGMINDLIHFIKIDSGVFALDLQMVDVTNLVENAITYNANRFREKEHIVHLKIEDKLPLVQADRDVLYQVINQLIANAYLVTPPRGEIKVRTELLQQELYISVEDQGGGIQADDLDRVFTHKANVSVPLVSGVADMGVGLVLAKSLIEAHGGRIWVEVEADSGSRFNIILPVTK
jgi:signal transduction histidine kinase